ITFFFFIGGAAATMIRLELATPQGDLVSSDVYNRLFTMHGVVMVWFFLIPSIPTTFGNFMVPLMIGARDLAFPRLNLTSRYLFLLGGAVTLYARRPLFGYKFAAWASIAIALIGFFVWGHHMFVSG